MRAMVLLLGTVLGIGAILLGLRMGSDPIEGLQLATRYTARAGFPLFIIAFTASSMVRLWPGPITKRIFQVRRWWGLSFALCHTLHLFALIAYFKAQGQAVPLLGMPVYLLMYALVATSSNAAQKKLGANWKKLHKVGVYALWIAFTSTYVGNATEVEGRHAALPFAVICFAALALRYASWRKKRAKMAAT